MMTTCHTMGSTTTTKVERKAVATAADVAKWYSVKLRKDQVVGACAPAVHIFRSSLLCSYHANCIACPSTRARAKMNRANPKFNLRERLSQLRYEEDDFRSRCGQTQRPRMAANFQGRPEHIHNVALADASLYCTCVVRFSKKKWVNIPESWHMSD